MCNLQLLSSGLGLGHSFHMYTDTDIDKDHVASDLGVYANAAWLLAASPFPQTIDLSLSLSLSLSVSLSLSLSLCLSRSLSLSPSLCFALEPFPLSLSLSISACLSLCLSVCLSLSLSSLLGGGHWNPALV